MMCDGTRLIQVLTNISSNGLQYTSAGGSVQLRLELIDAPVLRQPTFQDVQLAWRMSTGGYKLEKVIIRISIKDTGIGMSEEEVTSLNEVTRSRELDTLMPIILILRLQVAKVFQPFHRGEEGRANGIGLGLSIAKTLVEKMGGAINLESTLGLGSIFSFQLEFDVASTQRLVSERFSTLGPIRIGHTQSDPIPNAVPSATDLLTEFRAESTFAPLRFLVVDDNELNKTMFERTVNNMFFKQKRAKPIYTFAANGLLPLSFATQVSKVISYALAHPRSGGSGAFYRVIG
jgi:hypothetical protein